MKKHGFTHAEASAIVALADPPWNHIFRLLWETGARLSEVTHLTVDCVQADNGACVLEFKEHTLPDGSTWKPKRPASIRAVRVPPWPIPQVPPGTLLFFPGKPRPPRRPTALWFLRKALQRAGLPTEYATHCFRRGRITQALEAGADPHVVSRAVGHGSLTTTFGYLTYNPLLTELPDPAALPAPNAAVSKWQSTYRPREWKNGKT